jgi:PAS domain-containing protein
LKTLPEIKAAEERMRFSEEQSRRQLLELDTLYDTAPIGLGLVDPDLRYIRINQALAEINGVPIEKTLGRKLQEVLPELADLLAPLHLEVFRTGKPVLNLLYGR